jgi:hypothetical protein
MLQGYIDGLPHVLISFFCLLPDLTLQASNLFIGLRLKLPVGLMHSVILPVQAFDFSLFGSCDYVELRDSHLQGINLFSQSSRLCLVVSCNQLYLVLVVALDLLNMRTMAMGELLDGPV